MTDGLTTARTPTVWIDTNVMVEVMSQGDLFKDYTRGARVAELRRMMLQGSLWLAMGLDAHAIRTTAFGYEVHTVIQRLVPVGSQVGEWTWVWASFLQPYVFPAWDGDFSDDGVGKDNDERDQLMVDLCKAHGLDLVTRDGGVKKRARRAGFEAVEPEGYARKLLAFDEARRRFFDRLEVAALHHLAEGGPERLKVRKRSMHIALGTYRAIWEPAGYGLRYELGSA